MQLPQRVAQRYPGYGLYLYGEGLYAQETRGLKLSGAPVLFLPGNAGSYKQGENHQHPQRKVPQNQQGARASGDPQLPLSSGPHSWSWSAGCAGVLTPGPGEPQGVLGSSLLVLESRRVCWGPHSWSWRAAGCAGVLTPGPGEPQGVLGSSLLVLESRRVCWGPHSWSWRAAGCAGVLTPGPGEPQGVLGSSLLVLESRRVCWGPHSWSWRAAGCAGVLTPGPGEPQGVLGSSLLVLERVCWGPHSWSWRETKDHHQIPGDIQLEQKLDSNLGS